MNRSPFTSLLHSLAEEAIPSAEVDLWPAIRAGYEARKAQSKGDLRMKPSFAHHRRAVWIAVPILIALLILALLLTPQGRAWAQSALQFFTRSESEAIPAPTDQPLVWVAQTPGAPAPTITPLPPRAPFAAECGDYIHDNPPRCSIEQLGGKVNFTVKELGNIPEGMYFAGATGGPQEAYLTYDSGDRSRFIMLIEMPWTGSAEQKSFPVAPGVMVETVSIGNASGEYVKGSYGYRSGEAQETWMPDTGQETLKWTDHEVYYTLVYISSYTPLGKDGLAALAESLTTEPVSANITQLHATATPEVDPGMFYTGYPLTLAQAGEQAGFDLRTPARLPELLSFFGASFDADHNVTTIFYIFNQELWGSNTDGLLLFEQLAPDGEACELCGFTVGGDRLPVEAHDFTHSVVGADATVETVQISNISGSYVEGVWGSADDRGWRWMPDPYVKVLRWQKDGMAFELVYYGMAIDKENMIAIAESIP